MKRMKQFGGDRHPIFYDKELQSKKHIYVPGDDKHRILQHHYAFAFFADPVQQSFYKRFIRDNFRYKDVIQCSGHYILQRVRKKSIELGNNGLRGSGKFEYLSSVIHSDNIIFFPISKFFLQFKHQLSNGFLDVPSNYFYKHFYLLFYRSI